MTRQIRSLTRLAPALALGGALAATSAAQVARTATTQPGSSAGSAAASKAIAGHTGIWKWVVPPVKMNGMFDDHDPIGLIAGKLIPADCAFNWTDPDTHKLYCFTSATSLVYFLDAPQTYIAEANRSWRALKGKAAKAK